MDAQKLLDKLEIKEKPSVNYEGLSHIQTAYTDHIPFENLDVFLEEMPLMKLPWIYNKIVEKNRGGLCLELSSLFCWLLDQLGFSAQLFRGQVTMGNIERDNMYHITTIVNLNGKKYFCDVGMGNKGPQNPVEVDAEQDQEQINGIYKAEHDPKAFCYVFRRPKTVNHLWLNDSLPDYEWEKIAKIDLKSSVAITDCQWISDTMHDRSRDDIISKLIVAHKKSNFGKNGVILTTFKRSTVSVDTPSNEKRVTKELSKPEEVLNSLLVDHGIELTQDEKDIITKAVIDQFKSRPIK